MYFDENHVVTWVELETDTDTLVETVEKSCLLAEGIGFPALRAEYNADERSALRFSSHISSPSLTDQDSSLGECLLSAAYPALERFEFSEHRYEIFEDEGGTFADLVAPIRFLPKAGVTVSSISGFTANWAREKYVAAEYPLRENALDDATRVHSVFRNTAHSPDEVVVRLQLWLAAADLSAAVGLIRHPLRELDTKAVELLPAGTRPEEGYHAALIHTVAGDGNVAPETSMLSVARRVARFSGLAEDSVVLDRRGSEPLVMAKDHHPERESGAARRTEGIYVRLGADPLGVVENDTSREQDDEPENLDDPPADELTEEEQEEFLEVLGDMTETMAQVWVVVHADVRCCEPTTAEETLRSLTDELRSRVSSGPTPAIPERTLRLDTDNHRARMSIPTLDRDRQRMLDSVMTSLEGGMWYSDTRPWATANDEETVIRWRPHEPAAAGDATELLVRAVHGPPAHLWEEHMPQD
ncbi:hypothetical protein [Actinopolyspora mortivallis]|uniref:hypothetical protein n=1 Tax=Actinopolyspora mortivallis TaxID=33906 RepID=UPI00036524E6|nr:hypothetical protein [Actinopolyspora mortivallis]